MFSSSTAVSSCHSEWGKGIRFLEILNVSFNTLSRVNSTGGAEASAWLWGGVKWKANCINESSCCALSTFNFQRAVGSSQGKCTKHPRSVSVEAAWAVSTAPLILILCFPFQFIFFYFLLHFPFFIFPVPFPLSFFYSIFFFLFLYLCSSLLFSSLLFSSLLFSSLLFSFSHLIKSPLLLILSLIFLFCASSLYI